MMRGPTYDDEYISRKMNTLQPAPTFGPPAPSYNYQENGFLDEEPKFTSEETYETSESIAPPIVRHGYVPSARTQLILNRVALSQPRGYSPAPRLPPRMGPPPPYYDYDYGYGYGGYGGYGGGGYGGYRPYGGYGYGYPAPPPPVPRYRSYDPYLEEDYDLSYVPRYRPTRYSDTLVDLEKDKLGGEGVSISRRSTAASHTRPLERKSIRSSLDSEGDQPTGRRRYNALSEPQMLQDQVDKMRTRLQAMTFSLDPSGPVPEIIIPERSRRVDSGKDFSKKYTSALELTELPRLSARKHHTYVEDEYMKDNLRIKCLSHYKTTRSAAEYWKPKGYYGDETSSYSLPSYSSKYSRAKTGAEGGARWEEPDTVYSSSSSKELKENKPFSKSSEGDDDELRRDRFKKKRSKERDETLAIEPQAAAPVATEAPAETPAAVPSQETPAADTAAPATPAADVTEASAAAPVSAEEAELDEKEKKRQEKKKRKAEREAAAKAAMEAELAALAEAEAELARLEAESSSLKAPEETKAEDATNAADAKPSEKPAEK